MSSSAPLPKIRVAVACGTDLCDTEEGRQFLQRRQALFGKVCFILSSGLYVLVNSLMTAAGERSWFAWVSTFESQLHLGLCLVFLAVWLVCRRPYLSHPALAMVDAVGALLVGVLIGLTYQPEGYVRFTDYPGIVALAVALFLRSFTVPSSSAQTFVTSMLAAVPVVIGYSFFTHGNPGGAEAVAGTAASNAQHLAPSISVTIFAVWCGVITVAATVASRLSYGLQQEVRDARELGQYTLEERIGEGGMGEVYKASHALLRRPTAVKVLRPEHAGEKSLARFEREVQLTSRLTHPNTIAIYDYGRTPEGIFYYAMELLAGLNLEELVSRSGPQCSARVIHILQQVCASLSEAHATGLIHRDVKPANIFLCERGGVNDVVKVLDFGLVKDIENRGGVDISGANTITGTPHYLSPEVILSPDKVDGRSDIYAVGAVGYFLLTGKTLFESDNVMEICSHHLHTEPVPPSERLGSPVPEDLERLVLECLKKDMERRPQAAATLRERLGRCEDTGRWTETAAEAWWRELPHRSGEFDRRSPETVSRDGSTVAVENPATGVTAPTGFLRKPAGETSGDGS